MEDDDFDESFEDDPADDSFGEDIDDDDELGHEDNARNSSSFKEFTVLDAAAIRRRAEQLVQDLAETLCVSPTMASLLLRANNWDSEKIQQKWWDDSAKLLAAGGLQFVGIKPAEEKISEVECRICDDDFPPKETRALGCGHRFCVGCWTDVLNSNVNKGTAGVLCHCPSFKCPAVVEDTLVEALVPAATWTKFQQSIISSFVEDSAQLKWCPAARCESAILAEGGCSTVECTCGCKFCFRCGEEHHAPISCTNLATWLDKCRNESETAHWIIVNTKKCPKCLVRIEKNQGCNHMTCRTCSYEFCWICMDDWAEHGNHTGGFYKCNKFDPKKKKEVVAGSPEEVKAELDRYLHYYQRYHNHDQSKRFAQRQLEATQKRMTELQKGNEQNWVDVQFLKVATDQVFECRQVLKYTYAFGYYLKDGPEKELFEYLQQELERNTEHLSELSEKPLDALQRQDVVNYTRVTKTFLQNLLDGVANGLTRNTD